MSETKPPAFADPDPWKSARRDKLPRANVLAQQLRDGRTVEEIAQELGRSVDVVRDHLMTRGWSVPTGQPISYVPRRDASAQESGGVSWICASLTYPQPHA